MPMPHVTPRLQVDLDGSRFDDAPVRHRSPGTLVLAVSIVAALIAWASPSTAAPPETGDERPVHIRPDEAGGTESKGESPLDPATTTRIVESITADRILAEVTHLAGDEFYGRFFRSPMAFTAAEWIRDRFAEAGLEPGVPATLGRAGARAIDDIGSTGPDAVDPSAAAESDREGESTPGPDSPAAASLSGPFWFQPIEDPTAAPNVIGVLPARGVSRGSILVTAHYDHLPPRRRGEDRIYNGADDNASGTCGMIAVARALSAMPEGLPCDVVFIAFTGEEAGLKGARHHVANPTVPIASIRALLNLDMISRGEANTIFVDGTEISEPIRKALRIANESVGLDIRFDEHPDWLDRSDQGPYLAKGVPAVLFSVEDHEDYHQVTDHADRILPELAAKVSRVTALAVVELARSTPTPEAASPSNDSTTQPKPSSTPMGSGRVESTSGGPSG